MPDLAELFARDPLELTDDNIKSIIEEMRKSRHAFNAGNAKAGSTKPQTEKQKAISSLADKLKIDL
jgi:hypothetical protein